MEVKLRSCSTNFGRKGVIAKNLTLFDPPVTSQVEKINSMGLYLVHFQELFSMPLKLFRSELLFRSSEGAFAPPIMTCNFSDRIGAVLKEFTTNIKGIVKESYRSPKGIQKEF